MKKLLALLLALVMLVSLVACGPEKQPDETKAPAANQPDETKAPDQTDGPDQTEAPAGESETPLQLMWSQSNGIESHFQPPNNDKPCLLPDTIFNTLFYSDYKTRERIGGLAEDWGVNADNTEFWIQVRKGVKFHDGHELDINDVYFTFMYYTCSPASKSKTVLKAVEGYQEFADGTADTISGMRIEGDKIFFKLTAPNARFLNSINIYVYPEHCFEGLTWEEMDDSDYWKKPIGTGAYKLDEVAFPDYCTVVRNDDYFWPAAGIKNITFKSYQSGGNDAQITAIMAGELDYISPKVVTTLEQADAIETTNPDVEHVVTPVGNYRAFVFNLSGRADGKTKELLKDPDVRKAISLLIDEETIASFYPGIGQATCVPMHPNYSEAHPDIMANHVGYDPETAKALLTEAGWDFANDILDIAYFYTDQTSYDIMGLIMQQFREAGVKVNPWLMQGNLVDQIYTEKNYDMLLSYLESDPFSPASSLKFVASTSTYTFMGDLENRTERYDALFTEYTAIDDQARRKELALTFQEYNYEDTYIIPMYVMNTISMYNSAHIQLPEDFFTFGDPSYFRWDEWKILH